MLSAKVDSWLAAWAGRHGKQGDQGPLPCRQISTPVGMVRLFDSAPLGSDKPVVIFVPDGPNVIEHHAGLFALLTPQLRVVCFDMPGFGFSYPQTNYTHGLDQGAAAVLGVLDSLGIARATLAFSCANGFYALRAARIAPKRINGLVLVQTPALAVMPAWTQRAVPWPLRIPVVGHILMWLARKKLAHVWYQIALPRDAEKLAYQATAKAALETGGCFCLAGVVQGLGRASSEQLTGVGVPCTMIWGGRDHSHKHTDPSSLLREVPQAEIVHFSDCGHFPELEQSQRYANILIERVMRDNTGKPVGTLS